MKFWRVHRLHTNYLWAFDREDGSEFELKNEHGDIPMQWPGVAGGTTPEERLRLAFPGDDIAPTKLGLGEYHPRIWRRFHSPDPGAVAWDVWTMSVHAARHL